VHAISIIDHTYHALDVKLIQSQTTKRLLTRHINTRTDTGVFVLLDILYYFQFTSIRIGKKFQPHQNNKVLTAISSLDFGVIFPLLLVDRIIDIHKTQSQNQGINRIKILRFQIWQKYTSSKASALCVYYRILFNSKYRDHIFHFISFHLFVFSITNVVNR